MAAYQDATQQDDDINISGWSAPVYPETGHSVNALGGNDTVLGSAYDDLIQGGYENDLIFGNNGDDTLVGQQGNDVLYGGNGSDFVHGGSSDTGQDYLNGGAGWDNLYGGPGNDTYVHDLNGGVDFINDGLSEALVAGYGGGVDVLVFAGFALAELYPYHLPDTDDLLLTTWDDFSDGIIEDGVVIEDFYLNESNTFIELVYTSSDQQWADLTQLL